MELQVITQNPMEKKTQSMSQDPLNQSEPPTTTSNGFTDSIFVKSNETLSQYLIKNPPVNRFVQLMGVIWSSTNKSFIENAIQVCWNIFIRLGLLFMFTYGLVYATVLSVMQSKTAKEFLFRALFGITLILQTTSLWFSLFEMKSRMNAAVSQWDVMHLSSGLYVSYCVFGISLIIGIVPFFLAFVLESSSFYLVFVVGELSVCCILTATMFFITTDCISAQSLLDQLLELEKLEQLTNSQFGAVRDEIQTRRLKSAWINNSIVFVALLDILSVLIFVFADLFDDNLLGYLMVAGLFLKEIPFVLVVYWQVSQVNEKSAKLLKRLAVGSWSSESGSDNERVKVYVNAQGCPIVVSLAGMKLRRKDLMWQFAAWCVAFLVSIVKTVVESDI